MGRGGARRTSRVVIAAVSALVALAVSAGVAFVLASHQAPPRRHAQLAASPTPSPTPSHTKKGPLTSPFTGKRIKHLRRELIFKIDNVVQARPPTGLTKADIVYLLPVDGWLSRIMAVFSSHIPPVVGPVRSAREEDIKLLRQFGRPAFAFSGAQPKLLPVVEHARIANLYAGKVGGYYRDYRRIEPYNLYAKTRTLLREAPHASRARNIGFRFGPAPAGGKRIHEYHVTYPAALFMFSWSHKQHRWFVSMDGRLARSAFGRVLGGQTVVVQYTRIRLSAFRELGIKPPYAVTIGHGRADVLRDGRVYHVRWIRQNKNRGTSFYLKNGHRMLFARGQVWVIFARGPGSVRLP
ncbi:MAG TPA: DUF3048 domain-containing protein [Streptosporangiaceae bacterium]|nr:DUF3048 domain-containing protein [Streptosporangiaceae bacterium]